MRRCVDPHRTPPRTTLPHRTCQCYYTNEREWITPEVGTKEFFVNLFGPANEKHVFRRPGGNFKIGPGV